MITLTTTFLLFVGAMLILKYNGLYPLGLKTNDKFYFVLLLMLVFYIGCMMALS